jgi:AbrB family looped-hinge helix DNA binding protein
MEIAKITSRGQVTIPIDIRKKLGVNEGDKIVFIEDQNRIVIANAAKIAFANLRAGFEGEAAQLGLDNEQDVVALVDEVREHHDRRNYALTPDDAQ